MSSRKLNGRYWWLGILSFVGLGLAVYLVFGNYLKTLIFDRLFFREQLIARAEAQNIESFFENFGDTLVGLSSLRSIKMWGAETQEDMDEFVAPWRDSTLVGGVVLTDKNGIVKFNSNVLGTHEVGVSLADRDYFLWAKNQTQEGRYYVGRPVVSRLGATKDQVIVPVAAPIFQKDDFVGVVAASVMLKSLTERYLSQMKISKDTEVYLVDAQGILWYSSEEPARVGLNIFDHKENDTFLGNQILSDRLKVALVAGKEGNLQVAYLDSKTGKFETVLIAYSPVLLASQKYLVIVASPVSDVVNFFAPFYLRQE